MGYKGILRHVVEDLTGAHVYRTLPRGFDVFADLATALPRLAISTIFDVGANTGQSALGFCSHFPASHIYSFEPVGPTFRTLQETVRGHANIHAVKLALGAACGSGRMVLQGSSDMFYLQHGGPGTKPASDKSEQVVLGTVEGFCQENGIGHIEFPKIDTEGFDLDVLKGAARMLADRCIDVIQVEAGMNRTNRRHVAFERLHRLSRTERLLAVRPLRAERGMGHRGAEPAPHQPGLHLRSGHRRQHAGRQLTLQYRAA